jgi:hypothetical protein
LVIIKAPNKKYAGTSAGVNFANGEAQVKILVPHLKEWFERKGYEVIKEKEEEKTDKKEEKKKDQKKSSNKKDDK